ncbi:hypothetical protein NDU88_008434 [Pleurodeles waltl]|uniref:Uncharacterized protein n=1 Tax=Pleurodeles waltl TaxID=8319 RepID=A0AAV7RXN6_PLEWA|nr:hypothetical protein NDU88_008434 [Pleurodeles waltl]
MSVSKETGTHPERIRASPRERRRNTKTREWSVITGGSERLEGNGDTAQERMSGASPRDSCFGYVVLAAFLQCLGLLFP